jgi:cytochrome c peroxidase
MKLLIYFIGLVGISAIFGSGFSNGEQKVTISDEIKELYVTGFLSFQEKTVELEKHALAFENSHDLPDLREQMKETRRSFKRIEFLFDYIHSSYNVLYINGGPVPKLNEESDLVKPKGLQALDELLYDDSATEQIEKIRSLAKELRSSVNDIAPSIVQDKITDKRIIEALRSGIVSVFTLGLTGFDTPGCGNAMEEAKISFNTMEKAFNCFQHELLPQSYSKFEEVRHSFLEAQLILNANDDFDTFDRMAFLKRVVNPLYQGLLEFQISNKIDTSQFKTHAQNYGARNLFDKDFISTNYYAEFSFSPLDDPKTIKLGKTLFYDPILSRDLKMSCASCHAPSKAFADDLPKSKTNIPNIFNKRNSPSLIDAGFASRFFWDMREHNLEGQVAHVVNDSLEFNTDFNLIANRLKQSATYVTMFNEIYHGIAKHPIYRRTISNAIAAYVNSLQSFNSEFDQYVRNETPTYSKNAINGFNLFMGKAACGTCHFAPVFNGTVPPSYIETESEVLGLTFGLDTVNPQKDQDMGRMENGLRKEKLIHFANSFKTTTVRNSALTAPYMHNGQFETLEEVIEFYNQGGGAGMGLEINNQTLSSEHLNLSGTEKADLIAFLHTLTDTSGLTNSFVELPTFEHRPEWNDRGLETY